MKILITGPLGQDGIILTELLQNNHKLYGVCRMSTPIDRFNEHKEKYNIELLLSELSDINYVNHLIKTINPDVVINFAGETDVINPWGDIFKTYEQNFIIPSNILNAISKYNRDIYFFQSSSSLMYGRSEEKIINEKSKSSPMFPYGVSKLSTHNLFNEFKIKYGIRGCSGIFFNHESTHRNQKFITKKLSKLIFKILNGSQEKIKLFDLNFYRDVSHAEDFMSGVKMIIEGGINENFVFSSGESINFLELSKRFFYLHNLDFYDYIDYTDSKSYLNDYNLIGDNSKLKSIGWSPKYDIDGLIIDMVKKEII